MGSTLSGFDIRVPSKLGIELSSTPRNADPFFDSWAFLHFVNRLWRRAYFIALFGLCSFINSTGLCEAHVCKSRGHDVDMHGMASAFGI